MEKERRTREASAHASSAAPSAADIHDLLAAITMLEKKRDSCLRRQVPATRPATEYKNKSCQSSKRSLPGICHYPRHITKILDALARLCVSRAKREVIATALRVDPQARSVELIVAANGDVSMNILNHLKEMRTLLRRISSLSLSYGEIDPYDGGSREKDSPTTQFVRVTDAQSQNQNQYRTLWNQFAQTCIEFTFEQFKHCVNSKFEQLMSTAIDTDGLDDTSHSLLRNVRQSIEALELLFSRKQGAVFGNPAAARGNQEDYLPGTCFLSVSERHRWQSENSYSTKTTEEEEEEEEEEVSVSASHQASLTN
ncbi:hypothetical protein M432DRAFT_623574 [Thermoascus aurantiacus ATCC 26904]